MAANWWNGVKVDSHWLWKTVEISVHMGPKCIAGSRIFCGLSFLLSVSFFQVITKSHAVSPTDSLTTTRLCSSLVAMGSFEIAWGFAIASAILARPMCNAQAHSSPTRIYFCHPWLLPKPRKLMYTCALREERAYMATTTPEDTGCNDNVIITSKWCHDVIQFMELWLCDFRVWSRCKAVIHTTVLHIALKLRK